MEKIKEYSNGEVTVVWKPSLCIHSAKCVGNLPEVFKPKEKPWIQVNNSNTEAIVTAVKGCPSGALSYFMDDGSPPENKDASEADTTKVEVIENGPLMVSGPLHIKHPDGTSVQKDRITAFCRCGQSDNKPFCDGSHNK